jgi:hypothetical protein
VAEHIAVIASASEAIQIVVAKSWIASSQVLLAMTTSLFQNTRTA